MTDPAPHAPAVRGPARAAGGPPRSPRTDWETPRPLFDALNAEFHFTLDVAATAANAKCPLFYTEAEDGLRQPWTGRCWANVPYGRQVARWLEKAIFSLAAGEAELAVFLLPARTDTRWWHRLVLPHAAEIRFLPGRLRFSGQGPAPFPSVLIVFRPDSLDAGWRPTPDAPPPAPPPRAGRLPFPAADPGLPVPPPPAASATATENTHAPLHTDHG